MTTTSPPIFTDSGIREFKFRKLVLIIGREVLHACVQACCKGTFKIISEEIAGKKFKIKKGKLNGQETKLNINRDNISKAKKDPTGDLFDISFLAIILSSIQADHSSFYKNIKLVKKIRDDFSHRDQPLDTLSYEEVIRNFECLILEILIEAEDVSEKQKSQEPEKLSEISIGISRIKRLKSELKCRIENIKSEPIRALEEEILKYLEEEGQKEILRDNNNCIRMNPVEFFTGTKYAFLVSDFYTELEFHDFHNGSNMPQDLVIQVAENDTTNVIIEGIAGIGKTTLLRKIMAVKIENATDKRPLIHIDCRTSLSNNLTDFLSSIMPRSSIKLSKENLKLAILMLKPVFLVDGLDQLNENSTKIFNEIAEIVKRKIATIFATTRHVGVENFLSRMEGSDFKHLEVRGILEEKQEETIKNYMQIFSESFSKTSPLEDVCKKSIEVRNCHKECMKVPLINCLLVYLILADDALNSRATLFEIGRAIASAVRDYLSSSSPGQPSDLKTDGMVASKIFEASFKSLESGKFILESDTASEFGEVVSLARTGHKKTISLPDKSSQVFLNPKHIENMLKNKPVKIWGIVDIQKVVNNSHEQLIFSIRSMQRNGNLTREVWKDIVDELAKRKLLFSIHNGSGYLIKLRIHPTSLFCKILSESTAHPSMIESLSKTLEELSLDLSQDQKEVKPIPRIFEEECPHMTSVDLSFALRYDESSPSIEKILSSLKMKDIEMKLKFVTNGKTTNHHCDDYIRVLHGGSSRIKSFEGCLGEVGIRHLSNVLEATGLEPDIHLYIASAREASGLRSLNEDGSISIKRLKLTVPRQLCSELLPERLSTRGVDSLQLIVRDIKSPDDLDWVYDVARRILPKRETDGRSDPSCPPLVKRRKWGFHLYNSDPGWLSIHCTPMYEELKEFIGKLRELREAGLCLTTLTIDCKPPLKKMQVEQMEKRCKEELSCGFRSPNSIATKWNHSEKTIWELPMEVEELGLLIENEEGLKALSCLIERTNMAEENLDGGCNSKRGIRFDRLKLIIYSGCNAKQMPERFPIPSQVLRVQIYSTNCDITRTLEIMDRLPRISDSKCEEILILFENFSIDEDSAIEFLEQLKGKTFQEMRIYFSFKFDPKHESTLKSLKEAGILVR